MVPGRGGGLCQKTRIVRPGHYPWDHHPLSVDRPWHHENEEYGPARKTVPQTEIVRHGNRPNKRVLGKSIEERPEAVGTRKTFGHWEVDTVVGNKTKSDAVLLTLVERQTRFEVILKLAGKDAESVNQAVRQLRERAGAYFGQLFKTVTSDNGSSSRDCTMPCRMWQTSTSATPMLPGSAGRAKTNTS